MAIYLRGKGKSSLIIILVPTGRDQQGVIRLRVTSPIYLSVAAVKSRLSAYDLTEHLRIDKHCLLKPYY